MQASSQRNQTIALAAVCQAAILVRQAARGESIDRNAAQQLFQGIMVTSPQSVFDVYQNIQDLRSGTDSMLKQMLGRTDNKDMELTRYVAGIMALSKKLLNSNSALSLLTDTVEQVERRLDHFDIVSDTIISNFADGYTKAVSPLGAKIQVLGEPNILTQESVQRRVRAILLAGVRAGVLWRQMGGKRRQFIFNRKQILQDVILFHKEITSY